MIYASRHKIVNIGWLLAYIVSVHFLLMRYASVYMMHYGISNRWRRATFTFAHYLIDVELCKIAKVV